MDTQSVADAVVVYLMCPTPPKRRTDVKKRKRILFANSDVNSFDEPISVPHPDDLSFSPSSGSGDLSTGRVGLAFGSASHPLVFNPILEGIRFSMLSGQVWRKRDREDFWWRSEPRRLRVTAMVHPETNLVTMPALGFRRIVWATIQEADVANRSWGRQELPVDERTPPVEMVKTVTCRTGR